MPSSEFANRLEMSNQELIDNLNSRRYLPPPVQIPTGNPLYQNVMGGQGGFDPSTGYNDPYGLDRIAAQGRASMAYSDAMARQAERESLHTGIGSAMMAIPGVGVGLSLAYQPFAKAMGWLDPEEIYSQADYTKAGMAQALTGATMGQMGQSFLGGNLSMQQANSLSDDLYGFMQQRGFQGLELGRIAPMLGESGLLTPTGKFADTDEALNQFQNRLEGFLDKVASTVRTTSIDIESATALAISESMLAGSRDAVMGGDYLESAQMMSGLTGMNLQESELAMRQTMGPWGSTVYDRRNMAGASVFNVGSAQTAASAGGRWDAAWMNVDADQFGLRMSGWGNNYWASHRKDLGRIWAAGGAGGDAAWDSMIAGEGLDDVGSYGDIGNINDRLEAQFYGMQMASEDPSRMTAAAMGMTIGKMEDKGVESREAQIMYMMNDGWNQSEAAAFIDMHDQMSTPQGRAETYFRGRREIMSGRAETIRGDLTAAINLTGQLSQDTDRAYVLSNLGWSGMVEGGSQGVLGSITGSMDAYGLDPSIAMAPEDDGRYNLSIMSGMMRGALQRSGLSSTEATAQSNEMIFGGISNLDPSKQVDVLSGMDLNIRGFGNANVGNAVRQTVASDLGIPAYLVTEQMTADYLEKIGGAQNIRLGDRTFGEITSTPTRDFFLSVSSDAFGIMQSETGSAAEEYVQDVYSQSVLESNVENMLLARYGGGEAQAEAIALAGEGGYFRNVGSMAGAGQYGTATRQMDAIMLLGETTETSQGYLYSAAHQEDYQTFRNTLEGKDYSFYDAIESVDHSTAEGQIMARDNLAQAGYGKSYAQLTQTQRNYVEEIFHKNDSSGNWAGRHDDLVETAWGGLRESLGGVQFGDFSAGMTQNLKAISESYNVQSSQVEAYNLYAIAEQEGADADTLRELRGAVGSDVAFENAQAAFQAFSYTTGRGLEGTQGLIAGIRPMSAITSATAGMNLSSAEQETIWQEFAEKGTLTGLDAALIEKLGDSNIGEWAAGDITGAQFFEGEDVEVPYGLPDRSQNRLTNIPEFQGAVNAVVTPAGGAMPVIMVEGVSIAGSLADTIEASVQRILVNDNESVQVSE